MLELKHITYTVSTPEGEQTILNDISIDIPDRKLIVFTGPTAAARRRSPRSSWALSRRRAARSSSTARTSRTNPSPSAPASASATALTDEMLRRQRHVQRSLSHRFTAMGVIAVAIPGWVLGTALGAAAGNILPAVLTNALGIAIYGMFIAIILPPAKENRVVAGVVVLSMVLSALFTYLPVLCNISSGFRIIVITLITAGGAALLFPIPDEPAEPEKEMPT